MTHLFTRGPGDITPNPAILTPSPDSPAHRSAPLTRPTFARSYPPEPTRADVEIVRDQLENHSRGMLEALAHRANPSVPLTERGKSHANIGLLSAARGCLEAQGVRTVHLSDFEIAEQALKRRTHSTSDFPTLLEGAARVSLMTAYKAVPKTFELFARRDDARDYRPRTLVQTSLPTIPRKKAQGAPYDRGTFTENGETWKVDHDGIILSLTVEAVANDELGTFARIPLMFAQSAALGESRDFYAHLCGNPVMGDNVELFHASRGNVAAGGSLATSAPLEVAFTWLRTRKDAGGNPIFVVPKFLVCAAALEIAAHKLFSTVYAPATAAGTNALDGRSGLSRPTIIPDPHIDALGSATMHFLIADPTYIETLVYGRLGGKDGPSIAVKTSFESGGVDFKLTNDFGVKAADWSGMYQLT